MNNKFQNQKGFTLIELLAVILIISVLLTLSVPAISSVLDKAKRTEAKAFMTKLNTALIQYQTEYRDWPSFITNFTDTTNDAYFTPSEQSNWIILIDILRANVNNPATVSYVTNDNKRRLSFIDIESKYLYPKDTPMTPTALLDPWNEGYYMAIDYNYDNIVAGLPHIKNGATNEFTNMSQIAIWSSAGKTNPTTANIKKWMGSWQ